MNASQYQLSKYLDPDALPVIVERMTGVDPALQLDDLLAPLALPFGVIDPIKTAILEQHNRAFDAAFAAGIACGLDPERLLLVRLSAAADRLERCVDRLEGAS